MGDKTAVSGDLRGKEEGREEGREQLILPAHYLKLQVHAEIQGERLFFHMTLARPGEALVFHLNSVAKQ